MTAGEHSAPVVLPCVGLFCFCVSWLRALSSVASKAQRTELQTHSATFLLPGTPKRLNNTHTGVARDVPHLASASAWKLMWSSMKEEMK